MVNLTKALEKHQIIGIDLDLTLISAPHSEYIHDYIINNPDKTYYLITFRSHGLEKEIEKDLKRFYGSFNILNNFKEIYAIPQNIVDDYYDGLILKSTSINADTLLDGYLKWKGKISSELNISILIDDDIKGVKTGCDLYNIELLDSYTISSL